MIHLGNANWMALKKPYPCGALKSLSDGRWTYSSVKPSKVNCANCIKAFLTLQTKRKGKNKKTLIWEARLNELENGS